MILLQLLKSFFVGIMASASVGPIFILTVSRSIMHGFAKGFVTAMGSSFADSLYFSLAFFGVLHFLNVSSYTMFIMNIFSTVILISLSIKILGTRECNVVVTTIRNYGFFVSFFKSFLITAFNPFLILFFMFVSSKIFMYIPQNVSAVQIILNSGMVFLGSLSMLSTIAFLSHKIGQRIEKTWLPKIFKATGMLFFVIGIYFLYQTILNIYYLFVG
jgi:L-lysine exporter family protein LysE/ArgO